MNRREILKAATALLGGIASPSLVRAVTEDAQPTASSDGIFDRQQHLQISVLCELIIPTTTTPGAISAGVPQFISMMVGEWYTETERSIFQQGLSEFADYCQEQFNKAAQDCDSVQLSQALSAFEKIANQYKAGKPSIMSIGGKGTDENTPFFSKLKELTILGYFTSEIGVTQSLAFNPMPMEYDGDIPLAADGKQWAQY